MNAGDRSLPIATYEAGHHDRMRHLADRWRLRNRARFAPLPDGERLSGGTQTAAQRRVLSDSLNILEQGEHVASASVGLFLRPVRKIFSAEGRELIDLYLDDEAFHGRLYRSVRRGLGLGWRPIFNPLVSASAFSFKTYVLGPLRSPQPAQEYARRVLLLVLLSEFLAEPLLHRFSQWMEDAVSDPSTRALLRRHADLVDREEHYHKAWVMLYRDHLLENLSTDVIVDHLKFFLIFSTPYRTSAADMSEYVRREYAPYFVQILRTKLRLQLDDADARSIIDGASRIRDVYVATARRRGHAIGYFRSMRALAAYRGEFAALIDRHRPGLARAEPGAWRPALDMPG